MVMVPLFQNHDNIVGEVHASHHQMLCYFALLVGQNLIVYTLGPGCY